MPRTGTGQYAIDVMAVTNFPGYEPAISQGDGIFSVDFIGGEFYSRSYLEETALLTGAGVVGGGIELITSGRLTSGSGAFSGTAVLGTFNGTVVGDINGSFFGPNAEELGASFSASNSEGGRAVGSFTGKASGRSEINLRLTDLVFPQYFYASGYNLYIQHHGNNWPYVRYHNVGGVMDDRTNGNFSYGPGISNLPTLTYSDADKVQSNDPNFTAYLKNFNDSDVRLQLYKIGSENKELALSYVNLGRWQYTIDSVYPEQVFHSFIYGLPTPDYALTRRTGSANYDGVVYGEAGAMTTGDHYDVRGTSTFAINFGDQTYTGALVLNGLGNGGTVDFGSYDFGGRLHLVGGSAPFLDAEGEHGRLEWRFYGPTGEEIGGIFQLHVKDEVFAGGALVTGVTVARRR